jgi:enoyl-CoA hydratase/carnithine racemase
MGNLVDYRTERGVALLTLNDPPVNSFTHEMINELDECITDVRFDEDVHVLVITGHGEHCFSSGANISMLREVDPEFRGAFFFHASEVFARLEHTPKLVIAALNGHAVGGGLEMALACDVRIGRRGAGTLALPELDLGLLPGSGGLQRLARVVGKGRAMQLVLEGTRLEFDAALSLGLLSHVWETETAAEFVERALEYAHRFTLPARPVLAVSRLKSALQAAYEMPLEQGLSFQRELQAQLVGTADAAEGIQAWMEKREPVFQGK